MKTTHQSDQSFFRIFTRSFFWAMTLNVYSQTPTIEIDNFLSSAAGTVILDPAPGTTETRLIFNSGTLGGARFVSITNNKTALGTRYGSFANLQPTGAFPNAYGSAISNDVSAGNADWGFDYGVTGAGLNLDLGTLSAMELFLGYDHVSNQDTLFLTLVDGLNASHTEEFALTPQSDPTGSIPVTARWDLSDFSGAGVNLSAIHTIHLDGSTDDTQDMTFVRFAAVPEPSSLLLSALALGGLGWRRRRCS